MVLLKGISKEVKKVNGNEAREKIYKNMDSLSIEMDALDALIECEKNISFCIDRINKSIGKGRVYNKQLEVNCRQNAA